MAYIELNNELQGIRGLMKYSPVSAYPLLLLAETLLQGESTLSKGEREVIATYVSGKNHCKFCQYSHGAAAAHHLHISLQDIEEIKFHADVTPLLSEKMKALLNIAGKVQQGGKSVMPQDIEAAKEMGATDKEIHDTVLIAAAFCMFNRYVDGLNTWADDSPADYVDASTRMAEQGYLRKETMKMIGREVE